MSVHITNIVLIIVLVLVAVVVYFTVCKKESFLNTPKDVSEILSELNPNYKEYSYFNNDIFSPSIIKRNVNLCTYNNSNLAKPTNDFEQLAPANATELIGENIFVDSEKTYDEKKLLELSQDLWKPNGEIDFCSAEPFDDFIKKDLLIIEEMKNNNTFFSKR